MYNWICEGEREHGWEVEEVDYDGRNATDLAIRMNEDRNREDFCVEVSQTCAGRTWQSRPSGSCCSRTGWSSRRARWSCGAFRTPLRSRTTMETSSSASGTRTTQSVSTVAAMMNALARVLVKRTAGSDINEHILSEDWGI